jgi:hypothetical protein
MNNAFTNGLKKTSFIAYLLTCIQMVFLLLLLDYPLPQSFYEVVAAIASSFVTTDIPPWEQDLPSNSTNFHIFIIFPIDVSS